MPINVDDMTAANPPRKRWLLTAIALIVPLVLIVGAAAWFVRTFVMPPSIAIAPLAFSPAVAPAVPTPPALPAGSETTGAATPAPPPPHQPQIRYTTNSAEVWAAVPLPSIPRTIEPPPEPELTTSSIEPTDGPVPLPPRRPNLSDQDIARSVPIPRPRPSFAAN
jgi:hypothetical protein